MTVIIHINLCPIDKESRYITLQIILLKRKLPELKENKPVILFVVGFVQDRQ